MNYSEKLKNNRYKTSSIDGRGFNEEMESDRGRSINSAAVRRLQQKTQVFPLETNAAVRSRLTHSLEVQQVGRYIAKLILKEFIKNGQLEKYGLADKQEGFVSVVEIACLLHDIGNPPFGHFGEEAINLWAKEVVSDLFDERYSKEKDLKKIVTDLTSFEGNAQGLRVLHSLQSLNLTYCQLACLLKYTRCAYQEKASSGKQYKYRKKKPGFYLAEEKLVKNIYSELSIKEGCRFPLTYIMEAADDISYCIADLDDAVDKGILSIENLHQHIKSTWLEFHDENPKVIDGNYLPNIAEKAFEKYKHEKHNKNHVYILTLRTELVNDLSKYSSQRYLDNHEVIFNGEFDESLLDGDDKFHFATETLRFVAVNNVFNDREVENLELKGYSIISGLLKIYTPLIRLSFYDFKTLTSKNRLKTHPIETRLYHNLSDKLKGTYLISVEDIFTKDTPSAENMMMELYYRVRMIMDYVSGMTDQFALEEFRNLTASV